MPPGEAELADDLDRLEQAALDTAERADHEGAPLFARTAETWAHIAALFRSDVEPGVNTPASLNAYLDAAHGEDGEDA